MIDIIGKITRRVRLWALRVEEQTSWREMIFLRERSFLRIRAEEKCFLLFCFKSISLPWKASFCHRDVSTRSRQFIEFPKVDISFGHFTKPLCREKPHLFLKAATRLIQHAIWKTKVLIVAKMALWLMLKGFGQNFLMHQNVSVPQFYYANSPRAVLPARPRTEHTEQHKSSSNDVSGLFHTHIHALAFSPWLCANCFMARVCVCVAQRRQ